MDEFGNYGSKAEMEQPYHPIGQPNIEYATEGHDESIFRTSPPSYQEVLEVRADRMAMVRDFIATVTAEDLAEERTNPWGIDYQETVLSCLRTILDEEWEHLRFALRDLAVVESRLVTERDAVQSEQ